MSDDGGFEVARLKARVDVLDTALRRTTHELREAQDVLVWLIRDPGGPAEGCVSDADDWAASEAWEREKPTHFDATIQRALGFTGMRVCGPITDGDWKLYMCEPERGRDFIVSWGSELAARDALEREAQRGRDVWLVTPDGSKVLPGNP